MQNAVVLGASSCLVHAPDLVQYGSKPSREIGNGPGLAELAASLRSYSQAVAYPPNQVFIGNLDTDQLRDMPSPWFGNPIPDASAAGPFGRILKQEHLYALMKANDQFDLLWLEGQFSVELSEDPAVDLDMEDRKKIGAGLTTEQIENKVKSSIALPLFIGSRLIGCLQQGHEQDESLSAAVLLENLVCKASGIYALREMIRNTNVRPESIDYIISCSEEAVGDRYNRGGGDLAKAIGEGCACANASGSDVKAFCCAPMHSLIIAASLVSAGVFKNVVVVGGGSLPKLGMKFQSHVAKGMPVLEDMLGAIAILVGRDDGKSPIIRLDSVGKHDIASGSSQQEILHALVVKPLEALGLRVTDVDKYATELHNPEITTPADRGDVPRTNYRTIGAMAVSRGEIAARDLESFVNKHGMPGYAPTQGHISVGSTIPSACAVPDDAGSDAPGHVPRQRQPILRQDDKSIRRRFFSS